MQTALVLGFSPGGREGRDVPRTPGRGLLGPSFSSSPSPPSPHPRARPGHLLGSRGSAAGPVTRLCCGWGISQGSLVRGGGEKRGLRPAPTPSQSPSAHTPQPNTPAPGANGSVPRPRSTGSLAWASVSSGARAGAREATGQDPRMPAGSTKTQSRAASQPRQREVGASVAINKASDPSLTRPDLTSTLTPSGFQALLLPPP